MLKKMECYLDVFMRSKESLKNSKVSNVISYFTSMSIFVDYTLLIPNDKNNRDIETLKNIEGAKLIQKCGDIGLEFALSKILDTFSTAQEVIDYLKDNTIIVENNTAFDKCKDILSSADKLSGSHKRHFTRKIMYTMGNYKEDYYKELTNCLNDASYFHHVIDSCWQRSNKIYFAFNDLNREVRSYEFNQVLNVLDREFVVIK